MKRFTSILLAAWGCACAAIADSSATSVVPDQSRRRVVLIVWDGMRPDSITEENTPRLWQLAHDGVRFNHHHSVYPTSTEVNGAALATGVYPTRSGLLANREYRPAIADDRPIDTGEWKHIRRGDELSNGRYLTIPTIAEVAQAAGLRTAIVGSKAVVFLHDRHAEWATAVTPETAFTIFAAAPMPPPLAGETQKLLGPFANAPAASNEARNTYAARALTEILWRESVPAFSLLWLSEPDLSQHETAPGSALALASIKSADRCLGIVLDKLADKKLRADTDVLVVSDHGFSTIERTVDLSAELNAAGFTATSRFKSPPRSGDIMVAGNGGTALFYVIGHDREITSRLVEWLQHRDFTGALFTREKWSGTFTLEDAHLNTADAPDVVMAFRWNDGKNVNGIPGRIITDAAGRSVGKGSHASLSPFDVHNTFVAAGPRFRRGVVDEFATANIDIAPTVLHLLDLKPSEPLDGRIVTEALSSVPLANPITDRNAKQIQDQSRFTSRTFGDGEWEQELRFTPSGKALLIDEVRGAFTPKSQP